MRDFPKVLKFIDQNIHFEPRLYLGVQAAPAVHADTGRGRGCGAPPQGESHNLGGQRWAPEALLCPHPGADPAAGSQATPWERCLRVSSSGQLRTFEQELTGTCAH